MIKNVGVLLLSALLAGCVTTGEFEEYKAQVARAPQKLCAVRWADHFTNVTAVPQYFTVANCQELARVTLGQPAGQAPGTSWWIGCADPRYANGQSHGGANGGTVPAPDHCNWR